MNTILKVFKFTFLQEIKKKSFLISMIIISLIILGITAGPRIYDKIKGKDESTGEVAEKSNIIYLLDEKESLPNIKESLESEFQNSQVINISPQELEAKKAEVKESGDIVILSIKDGTLPSINMYRKDFRSGPSLDSIQKVISSSWAEEELKKRNISIEDIELSKTLLPITPTESTNLNPTSFALSLVFCFLLFFSIYGSAIAVANSIAMEKSSRVMETLIVSADPKYILLGKVFAIGLLGILEVVWFAIVGYFGYNMFTPKDFSMGGTPLDFSGITIPSILLLLLIFVLGYALYVFIAAACGAAVDKIEDVNQAMMPIMMVSLASFYLSYFSISFMVTTGPFATAATFIPTAAPFYLPFMILNNIGTKMSILISLVILLLSAILMGYASIRIYKAGVMNYGKKKKFTELFKVGKSL